MNTSDYTHQNALKTSAEWYISKGLEVTLLRKGEKIYKQIGAPSCTLEQIEAHIVTGGNIGFRPGAGLIVLDIDIKNNQPGRKSYEALELPPTYTVKTPSGGFHCYFRKPANVRTKLSLPDYPGIDFLSGTTNVVCAGSSLANGAKAGSYEVVRDLPVADLPDDLVERLTREKHDGKIKHHASDHAPESLARIESVLDQLDTEKMDYDAWWTVVSIVHYECDGSAEGRQLAEKWSATFSRHDPAEFDKQWQHCDNTGEPRTFASLLHQGPDGTFLERFQKMPSFAEVMGEVQCAESVEKPVALCKETPHIGDWVVVPELAGEIAEWVDSCAHFHHPDVCTIVALHCLSILTQNRVVVGSTGVSMNLFSLVVGQTGRGKELVNQAIITFANTFTPATSRTVGQREVQDHPVLERVASGPALSRALAARRDRTWMLDEYGEFLSSIGGKNGNTHNQETIVGLLKYSSRSRGRVGSIAYSRAENNVEPVSYPFLSVAGMSTPEKLSDSLVDVGAVESGLMNRCVPVQCDNKATRRRGVRKRPIPMSIIDQCSTLQLELADYSVEAPLVIDIDPDADDLFWEASERWDKVAHFAPLWSRAYEQALRLGGLLALGTTGRRVTLPVARWAISFIESSYEGFIEGFLTHLGRDPVLESQWERIEAAARSIAREKKFTSTIEPGSEAEIATANGFVPRRNVYRKVHMPKKQFDSLMADLVAAGRMIEAEVANKSDKTHHKLGMIRVMD